jgi:hypothetical protein
MAKKLANLDVEIKVIYKAVLKSQNAIWSIDRKFRYIRKLLELCTQFLEEGKHYDSESYRKAGRGNQYGHRGPTRDNFKCANCQWGSRLAVANGGSQL